MDKNIAVIGVGKLGGTLCSALVQHKLGNLIVLAVKRQGMGRLLEDVRPAVMPDQVVLTVAAAITTAFVDRGLQKGVPVLQAMLNLPFPIGQGMTVLRAGRHARPEHLSMAGTVFAAVGRVATIREEDLMNAVTALSGSGPAYGYIIIESLAQGGVKAGLPRSLATMLAAQAILGAAASVLTAS